MSNTPADFIDLTETPNTWIALADGKKVAVEGRGTVQLELDGHIV